MHSLWEWNVNQFTKELADVKLISINSMCFDEKWSSAKGGQLKETEIALTTAARIESVNVDVSCEIGSGKIYQDERYIIGINR